MNERHIHTRAELTVSFLLVLSCYFVGNHQTQSCMAPFLTLLNFWFRYTFLGGHWTPPRPFIPRSWSFSNKTHFRHHFLLLFFISHPCTNDEKVLFIFDSSMYSPFTKKAIEFHFKISVSDLFDKWKSLHHIINPPEMIAAHCTVHSSISGTMDLFTLCTPTIYKIRKKN